MFGFFKRIAPKPKPIGREERLAKGWRKCGFCRGYGAYHNGYVRLGCHRCINGLTTDERQKSAQDWEAYCARWPYNPEITEKQNTKRLAEHDRYGDAYAAARALDWDHAHFRP